MFAFESGPSLKVDEIRDKVVHFRINMSHHHIQILNVTTFPLKQIAQSQPPHVALSYRLRSLNLIFN